MNPDFLNIFDRIYVISLPASQDRRDYIVEHFRENGIEDYAFFDATASDNDRVSRLFDSGSVLQFPPCFRCGQTDCGKDDCNNVLTRAQVATFDSYIRLWTEISDKDLRVLICEDDIVFNPWWRDVFTRVGAAIDGGSLDFGSKTPCLLRLGWAKDAEHDAAMPFRIDRTIRMSNPCHAINSAYARALLAELGQIDHTIDVFQHRTSAVAQTHAHTVFPPVAHELSWSTGALTSLIHPKEIHVQYLKDQGRHEEAAAHEAMIRAHIKHKFYRPLLVLGHPGCGSDTLAASLRESGIDIGSGSDGKDGLDVWQFATDDVVPNLAFAAARSRRALVWDHLLHAVCDIRDAVPAIMRDNIFNTVSYNFRRKQILAAFDLDLNALPTNFMRAVASYIYWNKLIQRNDPDRVVKVEDDPEGLRDYLRQIAFKGQSDSGTIATDHAAGYAGRRYGHLTTSPTDWASLPGYLWAEVTQFCADHGYALPDRGDQPAEVSAGLSASRTLLDAKFCGPSGWARSHLEKRPVDAAGRPLPWFTYGAIEFLSRVARPTDRVFEYGAGFGTLWWQDRVDSVTSVEHDETWCDDLRPRIGANVTLSHVPASAVVSGRAAEICADYLGRPHRTDWPAYAGDRIARRGLDDEAYQAYAASILQSPETYDIIVIDGMARRLCAAFAVGKVAKDGIIVLANSNRSDYDAAFAVLDEQGFRQIPFWGLAPGSDFYTATAIFTTSLDRLASARHAPSVLSLPEY